MSRGIYRALLRLLPRRRRNRFGGDMLEVFEQLRREERQLRGGFAGGWLWAREIAGVIRFVLREWLATIREILGGSPGVAAELRWIWRGIRGRGWSAPLIVVLLAGAIGVTAVTFSVADALVFKPNPFPESERVVYLEQSFGAARGGGRLGAADRHDAWARQRDLFSAVGGYLQKGGVFLQASESSEQILTADITLEFLDVLSVRPRWGRGFTEGDLAADDVYATLLSEHLARERFGNPEAALGRRLEATGRPLVVVGVMDAGFAFPQSGVDLWRLMDLRGPLTTNFGGVGIIARVAPDVPLDAVPELTATRAMNVGAALGLTGYSVSARPYFSRTLRQVEARRDGERMLLLLFGAGASLLLISCANIASLELAHAIRRSQAGAIRRALGASRGLLARIAAMEGAVLVAAGFAASIAVAVVALRLAEPYFPSAFTQSSYNPIDIDARAIWFSAAAAALAWVFVSLPAVLVANAPRALGTEQRTTPAGRARLRHQLTVVQVALAVALVIVGSMYGRSYRALLALDKGFDSTGVASVSASMPADYFAAGRDREAVIGRLLEDVRAVPGVLAASQWSPPPSVGDSPTRTEIWIDGEQVVEKGALGAHRVDQAFFDLVRLPVVAGRLLQVGDSQADIVIPESLARRFWPDGGALGGTISGGLDSAWYTEPFTVVGIVGDFRREATWATGPDEPVFFYQLWSPRPPVTGPDGPFVDSGGSRQSITISVRVATPAALPTVQAAVQRVDPSLAVTMSLVDDEYARQNAHILLASRSVGIFSLVSFAIAIAGLYGVIAFVVTSRTREIGIRMALGAAAADIRRMVLASSGRMVVAGAVLGVAIAFSVARWIESQLFGVSASDPATYLVVVAVVVLTAIAATWAPARRAAGIDPAVTLRAE